MKVTENLAVATEFGCLNTVNILLYKSIELLGSPHFHWVRRTSLPPIP